MAQNQLIGTEVSLYTGKLRCYLDYKQIPYEEVLSTREVYREVIIPRTGVRYIPVFITGDDIALQDTTAIIDFLEQRFPDASVYPPTPLQKLVALLLETYADEWLVIPAMHYRWNIAENVDFARREFGRTSAPQATEEAQYALGSELSRPFAGSLPVLGITADTQAAVEKSYLALLAELDAHFADNAYLLGGRPCIGDFGLIGPLYAHLYRDPYSGQLMRKQAPNVAAWVARMLAPPAVIGDFLPGDSLPPTLLPVLQRMFREQGPVIRRTLEQVAAYARDHQGPALPRVIGELAFAIEGQCGRRACFPYLQWMWQRAADCYQGLGVQERQFVDGSLQTVGGATELLGSAIEQRVERNDNRVVLVR